MRSSCNFIVFPWLLYLKVSFEKMWGLSIDFTVGESANKVSEKKMHFLKKLTNLKNTQEISTLAYIVLF
jgi:hypothetical protein